MIIGQYRLKYAAVTNMHCPAHSLVLPTAPLLSLVSFPAGNPAQGPTLFKLSKLKHLGLRWGCQGHLDRPLLQLRASKSSCQHSVTKTESGTAGAEGVAGGLGHTSTGVMRRRGSHPGC